MTLHFKLDENADPTWRQPLERVGYTVSTVADQHLLGATDDVIARTCQQEGLCLVTVDLDFANTIEYPPDQYNGLIVLRHPRPTLDGMRRLVDQIVYALRSESPVNQLWIVEPGRIRIHNT